MSDWPAELRRPVETYGPAAVYAAGLAALGYPPTWCTSASELGRVVRSLSSQRGAT